jgi:hypothetical protein
MDFIENLLSFAPVVVPKRALRRLHGFFSDKPDHALGVSTRADDLGGLRQRTPIRADDDVFPERLPDQGGASPREPPLHAVGKAMALLSASRSLRERGDVAEAARLADMATELLAEIGGVNDHSARLEREIAASELVTIQLAHENEAAARRLAAMVTSPWRAFKAHNQIALACHERGDPENARRWAATSRNFARGDHELARLCHTFATLGDVTAAFDVVAAMSATSLRVKALIGVADVFIAAHDHGAARRALHAARDCLERSDDAVFKDEMRLMATGRFGAFDVEEAFAAAAGIESVDLRRKALVGLFRFESADDLATTRRALEELTKMSARPATEALTVALKRAARRLTDLNAAELAVMARALIGEDAAGRAPLARTVLPSRLAAN